MHKLPFMPGYTFSDPTIEQYNLVHKFDIFNGFRVVRDSNVGIGSRPTDTVSIAYLKDVDPIHYDPSLTYSRIQGYAYQQFQPHFALFARKNLCFKAFFRQGVFNSPIERYRIRHVNIVYFLEDDTLSVIEPTVDNSGFQQGKRVKRARIVKNKAGDTLHWKDFNVGIDICIYGVVYHIFDCDLSTRQFLSSQGIDVGDKKNPPVDPCTELRKSSRKQPTFITPVLNDKRRRFLEYDRMVLSFTAAWNEDVYQITYFLTDDAIAVRAIQKPNSGTDPAPMFLKRIKVPKNWKHLPAHFPGCYLEYGDSEIAEYYTPKDFQVGGTIFIFGRRFFLHDCDSFTRKYYLNMHGVIQPEGIPFHTRENVTIPERKVSPHIKFGSQEDAYGNCLSVIPKPPKKDVIRQLTNFPKKLRYSLKMDAVHPEEKDRDFIMQYSLSDGTIIITELGKKNSGRLDGCFLRSTLVPKPNTGMDNPEYYTPEDFFIGAIINVFNHFFTITGADIFVYRYIEANPEKFSENVRNNIRNYFARDDLLCNDITTEEKKVQDEENLAQKLHTPLKKLAIENVDMDECLDDSKTKLRENTKGNTEN